MKSRYGNQLRAGRHDKGANIAINRGRCLQLFWIYFRHWKFGTVKGPIRTLTPGPSAALLFPPQRSQIWLGNLTQ